MAKLLASGLERATATLALPAQLGGDRAVSVPATLRLVGVLRSLDLEDNHLTLDEVHQVAVRPRDR